jgi:hypothetical protein
LVLLLLPQLQLVALSSSRALALTYNTGSNIRRTSCQSIRSCTSSGSNTSSTRIFSLLHLSGRSLQFGSLLAVRCCFGLQFGTLSASSTKSTSCSP